MAQDKIRISVLKDGRIKVEVEGSISPALHTEADSLLDDLARYAGGSVETERGGHGHAHTHEHAHDHQHVGGHGHDHEH